MIFICCTFSSIYHENSPLCRSDIPVTAARRAGAQLRAARAEQRIENVVAPLQENGLVPPVDAAAGAVAGGIDNAENIVRSEPSLPSAGATSEQSDEEALAIEETPSNMTDFEEQFPSFFQVKNGRSCRVYVSPDETSRSLRILTSVNLSILSYY
jgi:hypothetical protein